MIGWIGVVIATLGVVMSASTRTGPQSTIASLLVIVGALLVVTQWLFLE